MEGAYYNIIFHKHSEKSNVFFNFLSIFENGINLLVKSKNSKFDILLKIEDYERITKKLDDLDKYPTKRKKTLLEFNKKYAKRYGVTKNDDDIIKTLKLVMEEFEFLGVCEVHEE